MATFQQFRFGYYNTAEYTLLTKDQAPWTRYKGGSKLWIVIDGKGHHLLIDKTTKDEYLIHV